MIDDSEQLVAVAVAELDEDAENLPAPVSVLAQTEEQAHDDALLANLEACPRPNKLNFAFGQLLLARKFYDPAIRAELEEKALNVLLKAAVAIASEHRWTHPDGVTEIKTDSGSTIRTCKREWEGTAWECLSAKAEKYAHLTEDEILQNIQGHATRGLPRFWARRWMYDGMIMLFRRNTSERNQQVKAYYAARPDRRRSGAFKEEDEDSLVALYDRETTEHPDDASYAGSSSQTAEAAIDATDAGLKGDAEGEYEDEHVDVDDVSPEPGSQSSQRLPNSKKRDLIRHVDPELLAFLDRLTRDANFRSYMLGSDLEEPAPGMEVGKPKLAKDFDRELPKLATLVLKRYAETHGLSERTAQRRVETLRGLRDKDKHFLSRFGVERR